MDSADQEAAIVEAARLLADAETRAAFLDAACRGNSDLRQRLETLLADVDAADAFFEPRQPPIGNEPPAPQPPPADSAGERIGPYKLLEKIGEGGFGVVYMAEQEQPMRRRVALKVIKPGMDTKQVIARFEAERQALAMMEHPNIARVYDGGSTESGRPYFVLELVRGIPITEFCDRNRLNFEERLKLFVSVCQAVQHAHQKGIIHRDLKPTNVLVTLDSGEPVAKVIDFGVAKALHQRLTEKTLFTGFAQMIGTPAYMSPEQAEMSQRDVDTRSDIYSLGVLLYELLTGCQPHPEKRLRNAGWAEMQRIISEEMPPKPSTRLSTMLEEERTSLLEKRREDPKRIGKVLRQELDWIVMKTLEKNPARRYETANGLAMDIRRYLEGRPIEAAPPSWSYLFSKLARKHKKTFAMAAVVVIVLLGASIFSTYQAVRATRAEKFAESEGARSAQVARVMKDMLNGVGPSVALGRDTKLLREILDKTVPRLKRLKRHPAVEAELRSTLGSVYSDLGEYAQAEAMHREALAIRRNLHKSDEHREVATSLHALAWTLFNLDRIGEAEVTFRQALSIWSKLLPHDHPRVADSLNGLARTLAYKPTLDESERLYRQALVIRKKAWGTEHLDIAKSLHGLGLVLQKQGKFEESAQVLEEAVAMRRKLLGEHPGVAATLHILGTTLENQGKYQEAEAARREAVALRTKLLSEDHPTVMESILSLERSLLEQDKQSEADEWHDMAVTIKDKAVSAAPASRSASSLRKLAGALRSQGRFEQAKSVYLEAAETGDADGLDRAAWFLATCADPAIRDGHKAVEFSEKAVAATDRKSASTLDTLAAAYSVNGRFAEASSVQREAISLLPTELDKAEYTGRLKLFESNLPFLEYWRMGNLLRKEGKFAEAEAMYRQELAMRRIMFGKDDPQVAIFLHDVADALYRQNKPAEAVPFIQECLEIREQKLPDNWLTFNARSLLGQILLKQKFHDRAEPLLLSGHAGLKQREGRIPANNKFRLKETVESLVRLYEETNRAELSAEWQQKLADTAKAEIESKSTEDEP
jgi:serine/threonine protein kinase